MQVNMTEVKGKTHSECVTYYYGSANTQPFMSKHVLQPAAFISPDRACCCQFQTTVNSTERWVGPAEHTAGKLPSEGVTEVASRVFVQS